MTRALTVFVLFFIAFSSNAASVWKISKGNNYLYLGGTIHVLQQSDYPLPLAYKVAYEDSDSLIFETDIDAMNSADFQKKSRRLLTYKGSRTIDSELSEKTIKTLKRYLKSRNISFEEIKHLKPALLGLTLSFIEMQRMGMTAQGVDAYYHMTATHDKKPVRWLESPEQQLQFLSRLGTDNPNEYIRYTLNELDVMNEGTSLMKHAWRGGDLKTLESIGFDKWVSVFPEIYQLLFTSRNNDWMKPLNQMLSSSDIEFVLVGALHLVGKDGLLAKLTSLGFSVEQL